MVKEALLCVEHVCGAVWLLFSLPAHQDRVWESFRIIAVWDQDAPLIFCYSFITPPYLELPTLLPFCLCLWGLRLNRGTVTVMQTRPTLPATFAKRSPIPDLQPAHIPFCPSCASFLHHLDSINELWNKVIKVGYIRYQLSKQHNTVSSIINYLFDNKGTAWSKYLPMDSVYSRFGSRGLMTTLCIQNVLEIMTLAWVTLDLWWMGLFKWYGMILEVSMQSIANWNFTSRQSIVNEDLIIQTVSCFTILILGSWSL